MHNVIAMTLSDSDLDKWIDSEHTKIKHTLLTKYLDVWMRILGRYHQIMYWDCFAGRGELVKETHETAREGSPLLALELARKYSDNKVKTTCVFIEKDDDNCKHLKTKKPLFKGLN